MLGKRKAAAVGDNISWTITFDDSTALRSVVDAAAAIMQRMIFKIAKHEEDSQYYLMVDGCDNSNTCFINARILLQDKLEIHLADTEEFVFCVECRHMLIAMDNASLMHGTLILEGMDEDEKLCIRIHDEDRPTSDEISILDTYMDIDMPKKPREMNFRITAEIDSVKIRDIIKKGRKTHAEHLQMTIHITGTSSIKRSHICFSIDGDFKHMQRFTQDVVVGDDGTMVVRAADKDDDKNVGGAAMPHTPPAFDNKYPVDKIEAFVKNVKGSMLTAMLEQNMPIIFIHKLGDDQSFIRFLVAPVAD